MEGKDEQGGVRSLKAGEARWGAADTWGQRERPVLRCYAANIGTERGVPLVLSNQIMRCFVLLHVLAGSISGIS